MTKFSKEVEVDWKTEPTALKLTFKARWSWRMYYGSPPSGIPSGALYINENETLDPVWALPQGAHFFGVLNPEGVEVAKVNLQRDGEQFQPIFYRTVPSEGIALRMGPRWKEQHDIESVRSQQAVVYGVGRIAEDGGVQTTLWATIGGTFGDCPRNCIIDAEIDRCLYRGAVL